MKIIERGKKIDLSIRFICDVCGCVFEAERNGYEKLCAYSGFVGATENREENPMWWKDDDE